MNGNLGGRYGGGGGGGGEKIDNGCYQYSWLKLDSPHCEQYIF